MFRDDANWRQPMGRKAMADTLQFYIGEARKTQAGVDLLGETPAKSGDILNAAKRKQGDGQQDTEQDTLDLTKPKAAETSSKPAGENAGSPSGAGEGKPVEVAQEAARKPAAETGAVKKDENSSTDGGTKSVRSAENVAETSAPAVETAAGRSDNQTNPPGQGNDSPQDEGSGKQEKLILGNTLQQRQQQQATKPFRQWLSLAAQGFGYKIVDTGLPFGAKDHWGHFHSFGTQLIDRLLPGDKLHLALDKMTVATPAMRAYIKEHMSAPWFHRVWFGHDPLANLGMVIDKFGVEALPDWAFGLLKDSMSKAGIPLPGVQWLVQGGLVSDKFATEWLSLNVGEALSGGLSILGTYRLYKKMKNGQQIHRGWAVAGILFKTVGGVLSSNPVLLMSAAADTVILMKAGNAAEVKAGLSKAEELRRADPFGDPPIMGNTGTAAPAFFSALGRAVEAMKQEKAPASQWMGMIKNTQGVKAEEVAWLGLEDWLNAQQGSITKKQITDFIRENQVQVQDVVKGYLTDEMVREALDLSKEFWDTASQADQKGWREEAAQYEGHGSSTKFQSYQVPGGENYRELLLTLPQKRETLPQGTTYGPNGEILDSVGSPVSRASIERMMPEQGFKSSHFDEPNILAHVRFNDRVVDGKKVLFLEEVQSDYAQAKRRGKDVPDAPFINNTSDWASLALKRMIRYASENGYYSISWTTGDVQAERYDLSKQIDRIEYTKRADGTYNLSAEKGTTPLIVEAKIDLNRISDLVGKEIADKIQKGEGKTTGTFEGNVTAELTGLDLKVGGDGMRGFYDKILVDAANKLGKKFGAKVGQADIGAAQEWGLKDSHGWAIGDRFNSEVEAEAYRTRHTSLHDTRVVVDGALSVHSLPITQSMRDSVMQGQPLFNQGDNRLPTTSFIVTKAQISAARDEVMAITNKILGHTISVNVVDRLPSPMPAEFIAAYDQRDQSIWISMKAAKDFANNAGHESLHALRHIGAITPIEWTALVAVAKKNGYSLLDDPQRSAIYRREYVGRFNRTEVQFQDMLDEEAVADMFGDYVSARSKATPFVQKIMDKISEWVEAMVNLMQGHGIETGRGAMRKAYSGEMAQRPGLNVRPQAIGTLGNAERNSPEIGAGGFADPFGDELKAADAEDFAGNINLKKLNTTDDIKDLLRKVSNEMGGFIAERRGVRSHQMTKDLAFEMGMTEAELLKRQTGDAWNAESLEAARMILLKSAESVLAMAETAKTTDSLSVLAEVIKKYNRHRAIQEQVAGLKAEAGRSLNILKTMVGVDPLQRIDAVLSGVKGRKTSFGAKVKGDEAMARELVDMITGLGDPAQISNFIAQSYKITIWDKIRELWINMLLSGPRTHATNILSNTLTALWQVPETAVAATIGAFHGGEKVQAAEATARLIGIIEGAKEGAIAAAHVLKTGEPPDVISKIEQHQQKAIGGMTGTIVRIPGVLLQAEDQVFKAMSYRAEINALAVRMAISEGRTGKGLAARIAELRANPSMKMKSAAHESALYNTFQNKLGPIGQMIQNLREAIPGAWIILPFLRTPANIIKYAAERTPFGLAMKPVRDNLRGLNGNVARDTQLARLALGTALMAATVSLVAAGMVSGSGPDDPDEKNMLRETGWQPYSIKIGGKWYSYQRLDPLAFVIGITADMFHLGSELPDYQADKIASLIIGSITNNVLDKTWLSGLSDFINAIQEPGRFGAGYVRRLAGSAVPALVAQTAQVIDPNLREARTIVDTIKSRVPYMSQSLLPRRNVFGEEIKRQGALGPDILSPIFTSQVKDNPAAAEMLALKYYPSMPTRDVNGHRLSSEQYDRYAELAGKLATEQVNKIIATDTWNNRSDDKKIDKIKDIFEEARRIARVKLKQEWQELAQKVKKQKG